MGSKKKNKKLKGDKMIITPDKKPENLKLTLTRGEIEILIEILKDQSYNYWKFLELGKLVKKFKEKLEKS